MKNIAIIPARSGSKGLKDKNIKLLNGKPLIVYTIEAAINSEVFDNIIVSTDSEKYAEISKNSGANVPFLRPDYLSDDKATSTDVIIHALESLKNIGQEYDNFMLLQPTSPLRTYEDIINSVKIMIEKKANAVISVCESEHSPLYVNTLDKTLSMEGFLPKGISTRRQDLPKHYRINGAIYLCKIDYFLKYRDFYKDGSYAYIMENINSIDIDNQLDFIIAEAIINNRDSITEV